MRLYGKQMFRKKHKPTRYKEDEKDVTAETKSAENGVSEQEKDAASGGKKSGARRKKKNSWIFIVLIIFFSAIFVFSLVTLIRESLAEYETEKSVSKIQSLIPNVPEKEDGVNLEIDPERVYSIADFSDLIAANDDTIGWFYMPCRTSSKGLPIDIALLRGDDDSFYLSHDFYKKSSVNGWVYLSSDCNGEDITKNRNMLIYGHARSYKMFGGLKNLNLDKAWQENPDGHYIKISTPYEDSVWEIFSWHETTVEDFYWQTSFSSDEEFVSFAERVQSQDQLGCFKTFTFAADDRIMTLSTCKGLDENVRVAVHAKLIVSVPRNDKTE